MYEITLQFSSEDAEPLLKALERAGHKQGDSVSASVIKLARDYLESGIKLHFWESRHLGVLNEDQAQYYLSLDSEKDIEKDAGESAELRRPGP